MKLKLDANLGTRGQRFLVGAGHDVTTAAIQGLASASDDILLAACAEEGRALMTLDTDFADAMRHPPAASAGIVALRTLPRATVEDIEFALRAALRVIGEGLLVGRLLVVDHGGRVREYQPADH